MKHYKKSTLSILLTILFILSSISWPGVLSQAANTNQNSNLEQETFQDLNQQQFVEALSPGWNLGNQLESVNNGVPGETNWGNPVITKELLTAVKEAGFSSVRIPVSYLSMIGEGPDYTINEQWLDRVQEVVDYCVSQDLYAIINIHGDGYETIDGGWLLCSGMERQEMEEKFAACWRQIAKRFADYDEHLIFESMNEIYNGCTDAPDEACYEGINTMNQIFVDTVRQSGGNNDKRWLLIPGWNTNVTYTVGDYGFQIPTDTYRSKEIPEGENRISISVHYYEPWDFCGGESGDITQWGASFTNPSKTSTHSGEDYMESQFRKLKATFVDKGYPVIFGEYGSVDKTAYDSSSTFYRADFARKLCQNCVKYGCIPVYWDNGWNGDFGFALFDRSNLSVTQPEIIAAIQEVFSEEAVGTATGISLNQQSLTMKEDDEGFALEATLEPSDCTDKITWSTSDATVATVSHTGFVRPQGAGQATITASTGNLQAQCSVTVQATETLTLKLYVLETTNWNTIQSMDQAVVSQDGGTYTLTLKTNAQILQNIGSISLKDMKVQSGKTSTSILDSANIHLEKVTFNGVPCEITVQDETIGDSGAWDYALLNQWVEGSEKINGVEKKENGSYIFTAAPYQEENTLQVTFTISNDSEQPEQPLSLSYRTHVQNEGWQDFVTDGATSGTSGKNLRLEAIEIDLNNNTIGGGIEYRTHVQNEGWQNYVADGAMSGTKGKSLRLEAIQVRLTGAIAEEYDIYYRTHIQDKGWLGWAVNDGKSGSAGLSKRLEAIQIRLVEKGGAAPGTTDNAYLTNQKEAKPTIHYRTHVQNEGWQNYVTNGELSGTTGKNLRLEAIQIKVNGDGLKGSVEYSTHVQNQGWQNYVADDTLSGTKGKSLRLEAIKIRLTDELAEKYSIEYRTHVQNQGWQNWVKDNAMSGTTGKNLRLEAIQIRLIKK